MRADAYSFDDKRSKIESDDIPDIIERFHNLDKGACRRKGTEEEYQYVTDIDNLAVFIHSIVG